MFTVIGDNNASMNYPHGLNQLGALTRIAVIVFLLHVSALASNRQPKVRYYPGPCTVRLGPDVMLNVPPDFFFLDQNDSIAWAQYAKLFNSGNLVGILVHQLASRPVDFTIQFRWEPTGFCPEPSLESTYQHIKHGYYPLYSSTSTADLAAALSFDDLIIPPEYDRNRHIITFATRQSRDNESWETLQAAIYGRHGKLVADLTTVKAKSVRRYMAQFRFMLDQVTFVPGATYEDYRPGDRIERAKVLPIPITPTP